MARAASERKRHEELLKRAKELCAVRVKVVTVDGQSIFKDIGTVLDTDEIQAKTNGDPIVMLTAPGRRSEKVLAGQASNTAVQVTVNRKREAVKKDPIIQALSQNPDSPDVLIHIVRGIGEEVASLGFERQEAELDGKDTATLSSRRIQGLRAMGETLIKRLDQISGKALDLDGPAFKKVFGLIIETFRETMAGLGYRQEEVDTIMAKFSGSMTDEWKAEAKNRIKSA